MRREVLKIVCAENDMKEVSGYGPGGNGWDLYALGWLNQLSFQ